MAEEAVDSVPHLVIMDILTILLSALEDCTWDRRIQVEWDWVMRKEVDSEWGSLEEEVRRGMVRKARCP